MAAKSHSRVSMRSDWHATAVPAGRPNSMPYGVSTWRLWLAMTAAHPLFCIKAQLPLSDWRTGIATNYGGVQDGRVGMPIFTLM